MKIKILRGILIILIIAWMWLVFGLSSDNAEASSSLSFKISKFFAHTDEGARMIQPYIRKLAHLSEYTAGRIFILWIIFNLQFKFEEASCFCRKYRNFVRNNG